jgi:hypothetical protein
MAPNFRRRKRIAAQMQAMTISFADFLREAGVPEDVVQKMLSAPAAKDSGPSNERPEGTTIEEVVGKEEGR